MVWASKGTAASESRDSRAAAALGEGLDEDLNEGLDAVRFQPGCLQSGCFGPGRLQSGRFESLEGMGLLVRQRENEKGRAARKILCFGPELGHQPG